MTRMLTRIRKMIKIERKGMAKNSRKISKILSKMMKLQEMVTEGEEAEILEEEVEEVEDKVQDVEEQEEAEIIGKTTVHICITWIWAVKDHMMIGKCHQEEMVGAHQMTTDMDLQLDNTKMTSLYDQTVEEEVREVVMDHHLICYITNHQEDIMPLPCMMVMAGQILGATLMTNITIILEEIWILITTILLIIMVTDHHKTLDKTKDHQEVEEIIEEEEDHQVR